MATTSIKFQIYFPKHIREQVNVKAGQKFIFVPKGNLLCLVPQLSIKDIKGSLKGASTENIRDHGGYYDK